MISLKLTKVFLFVEIISHIQVKTVSTQKFILLQKAKNKIIYHFL